MNEIILGDALDVLRTLEPGSVDAICTDLPYGVTACAWDAVIPFAPMWECVKHVLKPRGVFVTTASQPFTSALVMSNPKWFKYEWIYEKTVPTGFLNAKVMPMRYHENILVFAESMPIYNPELQRGVGYLVKRNQPGTPVYGKQLPSKSENTGNTYQPKSIIRFSNINGLGKDHPTQKPVALYEYLIRTYTNAGDTVLDFCMGSGTTGVAAVQTGRHFIGCEIDEGYFKIAEKRIAQAQAQPPLIPHEAAPMPVQTSLLEPA